MWGIDKLDRLSSFFSFEKDISINNFYDIEIPFEKFTVIKSTFLYDNIEIDAQCNQYGDSLQINGVWFQYEPFKLKIVCPYDYHNYKANLLHFICIIKDNRLVIPDLIKSLKIKIIVQSLDVNIN